MPHAQSQDGDLPALRPGQCPVVKDGKRCARPAGHGGLCDPGPLALSLDLLFGEV